VSLTTPDPNAPSRSRPEAREFIEAISLVSIFDTRVEKFQDRCRVGVNWNSEHSLFQLTGNPTSLSALIFIVAN